MRKFALLAVLAAALAAPSIAFADTAQGRMTGFGTVGPTNIPFYTPETTVIDGGTSYVGLENDKSGSCSGDGGTVVVDTTFFSVICAHYVASSGHFNTGSPKMRFAYVSGTNTWTIVRITDNSPFGTTPSTDTFAWGTTNSLADATDWVNRGVKGSGHPFSNWGFLTVTSGDYSVFP